VAGWLILACGVAYLWTALEFALRGRYWLALVFFAYALANIGLYKEAVG
jgi:hypothetical protein